MQPKKEMSKEGCGSGGFKITLKKKKKRIYYFHSQLRLFQKQYRHAGDPLTNRTVLDFTA